MKVLKTMSRFHLSSRQTALLAAVLLAFAIRVIRLDFQPLWWDEGYSLFVSTMDIGSMAARTAEDIHPPLYYLLLHLWIALVGARPAAVRLLSVVIGTAAVPVLYSVGRRLVNSAGGMLAALIMAVAPFHVYYSQEVRMYGLETLLGLLSVSLMLTWLERGGQIPHARGRDGLKARPWVADAGLLAGYVLTTSAAMYTHYYAAFIPLFQTIFILIRWRRYKALILRWLAAQSILLLLYSPWLIYTASKLADYVAGKVTIERYTPLGFYAFLKGHLTAFGLGHLPEHMSALYWAAGLFLLLVVLGAIGYKMQDRGYHDRTSCILFLLLYLFVPILIAYLINLRYPFAPFGVQRLVLFATPAYYLLISLGLTWMRKHSRPLFGVSLSAVLLISGLSLYAFYTTARYREDDYRPLIERVQAWARPEDAVICLYPWQMGYFRSYYRGDPPQLYAAFDLDWAHRAGDPKLTQRYLDQLMTDHQRVWFPAHQIAGRILESEIEDYLARHSYPVLGDWVNANTRLFFYDAGGNNDAALEVRQSHVNFDNKLQLVEHGLSAGPLEAGWGVVDVILLWRKEKSLGGTYRVGLRMVDEAGTMWSQRDSEPVAGLYPFSSWGPEERVQDRHGLLIPAGTPPGRYQVRVGVYRISDGRGLNVLDDNLIPRGVEVVLGTVEVVSPVRQPSMEALAIQYPLLADLTDRQTGFSVRFLGYSMAEGPFTSGQEISLTLFWQALGETEENYIVFIQLQDKGGRLLAAHEGAAGGAYPTERWVSEEFIRDHYTLLVPANVLPGDHHLIIGLYRRKEGTRLKVTAGQRRGGDHIALTEVKVEPGRERDYQRPEVPYPLSIRLGEGVALLGYDLETQQARPGGTLRLTLYWQALAPMDKSYTVFVHLLDADEHIQGQIDTPPGLGEWPTTTWVPGEYLRDEYPLIVKAEAQPGRHLIEIGMYDAKSGIRLPVSDESGQPLGSRVLLKTPIYITSLPVQEK